VIEAERDASEMSLGCTSFDKMEFLRAVDRAADHVAEAGVTGDLNTVLCEASDRGEENAGVVEDKTEED
jgi:hypothetical protein